MTFSAIHAVVSVTAGVSVGAMAVCLAAVGMPRDKRLDAYRTSRYVLAAGYFLLAAAYVIIAYKGLPFDIMVGTQTQIITLSASALQGVMFQHTILVLINPMRVTVRHVMNSIVPIAATITALVCTYLWGGEKLSIIALGVACGLYFLLLGSFERVFRRSYNDYVIAINNYFADDEGFHVKWISRAYYMAVALGVTAGLSIFLPSVLFVSVVGLIAVFYVYYGIRYVRYARDFSRMAPALETLCDEPGGVSGGVQGGYGEVVARIEEWIAGKNFSQFGITLDSMGRQLGLPSSAVAMYIRHHGGRSFRRWVNELRVEEAREVMIACRDMPLGEVCKRVGFGSLRDFKNSFENLEGEEPRFFQERMRLR